MYRKFLVESTFIELMNTKQKNMIIGCIYKHPKQKSWLQWKLHTIPNGQVIKRKEKPLDHGRFQY